MSRGGTPHSAASVLAAIGMPVAYRCRCGTPVPRPGNCGVCSTVEAEEERLRKVQERVRHHVPAAYRWASLRAPEQLRAAIGNPRVLDDIRAWLAEPTVPILLLRGDTHVLKSTVAGACVRWANEAGQDAFFVLAVDLAPLPERPTDEQREARHLAMRRAGDRHALVVLDDIAKVLGGAPGDSGQAHWRRGDLCAVIHRRWQAKARTIVTTTLENRGAGRCPGIVDLFGEDILARLTDEHSALVVRLERKR